MTQDAFEIGNKKRNNEFIRKMKKNALVHNFVVHKLVYQCFYLSFCHFVILSFLSFSLRRELRQNAYLCRAIVQKWTLDCPKVDTCVNFGDSFSDGYVSGAIFVRKKLCFLQQK